EGCERDDGGLARGLAEGVRRGGNHVGGGHIDEAGRRHGGRRAGAADLDLDGEVPAEGVGVRAADGESAGRTAHRAGRRATVAPHDRGGELRGGVGRGRVGEGGHVAGENGALGGRGG